MKAALKCQFLTLFENILSNDLAYLSRERSFEFLFFLYKHRGEISCILVFRWVDDSHDLENLDADGEALVEDDSYKASSPLQKMRTKYGVYKESDTWVIDCFD